MKTFFYNFLIIFLLIFSISTIIYAEFCLAPSSVNSQSTKEYSTEFLLYISTISPHVRENAFERTLLIAHPYTFPEDKLIYLVDVIWIFFNDAPQQDLQGILGLITMNPDIEASFKVHKLMHDFRNKTKSKYLNWLIGQIKTKAQTPDFISEVSYLINIVLSLEESYLSELEELEGEVFRKIPETNLIKDFFRYHKKRIKAFFDKLEEQAKNANIIIRQKISLETINDILKLKYKSA